MNGPSPEVRRLGQRLLLRELAQELAEGDGRAAATALVAVAPAGERVARKLGAPLSRLVGVVGCQALLARALHLAGREWPFLANVRAAVTPAGGLEHLGEALRGAAPARARDALVSVLAHLVWLLVSFIGEDLALHTVREAWPDLQLDDVLPDAGRRDTDQRSDEVGPAQTEATA